MLMLILIVSLEPTKETSNFNTSHVNVNHHLHYHNSYLLVHFNTSHVNVNLENNYKIIFEK